MTLEELYQLLQEENEIERIQRIEQRNVNDQHLPFGEIAVPKMPEANFFQNGNIFINKHHRYSEMPAHTHEFVEFNYMLSGSCTQYVDNEKIVLNQGDIILMDKESVQSIDPLGKDDILINILLKDESITTDIVVNMAKSTGVLAEFLMGTTSEFDNQKRFLFFQVGSHEDIQALMKKMILEYYGKDRYYIRSVNLLVSLLLIELTRFMENKSIENNEEDEQEIISILRYIEIHYKTLTLASLSQHFGYNPNYLSNKLKRKTGQSYKEIISYLRYRVVLELMEETDDSVEEITEKIGFHSIGATYKLLAKYTNNSPKRIRQNFKKETIS